MSVNKIHKNAAVLKGYEVFGIIIVSFDFAAGVQVHLCPAWNKHLLILLIRDPNIHDPELRIKL